MVQIDKGDEDVLESVSSRKEELVMNCLVANRTNEDVKKKDEQKVTKPPEEKEEPYRHTAAYRRKILRAKKPGTDGQSKSVENRAEVRGSSQDQHRVKSVQQDQLSQPTSLVYVGSLTRNTSEEDLRCHLMDIGVSNQNISDVFQLNSRSIKDTSFCVSLCDRQAEYLVYNPSNWPSGTRIRPFKKRPNRRKPYQRSHHATGPRFRKQSYRQPRHAGEWRNNDQKYGYAWRSQTDHQQPHWYDDHWRFTEDQHNSYDNTYQDYMDYYDSR